MEQLTKNQAVATSQEAVQTPKDTQLRYENAHNDKSVHGVLNQTYQAWLRLEALQPDIVVLHKTTDDINAAKSFHSPLFFCLKYHATPPQFHSSLAKRLSL